MSKTDAQPELVPRLRFPEFRDAPGWQAVPVANVATVVAGQSPKGEYYNDIGDGTPFYQGKTDFGDVFIDPPTKWTTQVTRLANEGDILMSVRAPVGALNISTQEICIGRGLAALHAKEHKWFLYYLLLQVNHLFVGNGGSVFDSISKAQIESTLIPYPPSPAEQRKIAECLGSLDDLIAAEGRKLEALREHKKGLMQQLFPREGETRPRLRFPEFQDAPEWEEWPLARLATEISDGDWIESKDQSQSGIRLVQTGNIGEGVFIDKEDNARFISDETFKRLRCKEVHPGDCLISRLPDPIGRACLVPDTGSKMITAVDCAIVRFRRDRIVPYLFIASSQRQEYYREVESLASGSTRKRISRTKLAEVSLYLPEMREQHRIADCLASLDAMIAAQAEKLDALRTHKRGLMQQLFPSPEEAAS